MKRKAHVIDLVSEDEDEFLPSRPPHKQQQTKISKFLPLAVASSHQQPPSQPKPMMSQTQQLAQMLQPLSVAGQRSKHTSAGCSAWVDKHVPKNEEELAVHRKKVQEVRGWLEAQLHASQQQHRRHCSNLLVISGPSGVGKSTTVRVLAEVLRLTLVEWTAPVPTLWSEHLYQGREAVPYSSKFDDFETFAARSKFPALALKAPGVVAAGQLSSQLSSHPPSQQQRSSQQASQGMSQGPATFPPGAPSKLVMVDDLPHAATADHRTRLTRALQQLALASRCPVVLICTESTTSMSSAHEHGNSTASGNAKGLHKDIIAALETAGATFVSFNPLTAANLAKVLGRVATAEGCEMPADALKAIAEGSGGDIRNALHGLQVACSCSALRTALSPVAFGKAKKGRQRNGKAAGKPSAAAVKAAAASSLFLQRDLTLTLFHTLGKVLYNKRGKEALQDEAGEPGSHDQPVAPSGQLTSSAAQLMGGAGPIQGGWSRKLHPSLERLPLPHDPESLLIRGSLEALVLAGFLQENYPAFIADSAIDDIACAAGYLSDAAYIACYRSTCNPASGLLGDEFPGTSFQDSAASSVAVRGLLFANAHPAPRRWQPLRAAAAASADRAATRNAAALQGLRSQSAIVMSPACCHSTGTAFAAQLLPRLRALSCFPDYHWLAPLMPIPWCLFKDGGVTEQRVTIRGLHAKLVPGVDTTEAVDELDEEDVVEDAD